MLGGVGGGKDWTTIKGWMKPEGDENKNRRDVKMKGWWRREGKKTHLKVAGMQCNIRKTYTLPLPPI